MQGASTLTAAMISVATGVKAHTAAARILFVGDSPHWPCLLGYAPGGAASTVPDDPPLGTGAGSTGADVGCPAAGTGDGVAPLPPTAGSEGVCAGTGIPPLPPDGAEGVDTLMGVPMPPPPPVGWGVVVVDWGAAIGAGVVGDGPPVGCWVDGARGGTVCVMPAVAERVLVETAGDDISRMLTHGDR